jgi:LuxR family maltose regulon positive regulatory protein
MQQYPILKTKLHIPPVRPDPSTGLRPRLVSRPRLSEQLNAGLNRKLTLISAPAGFGKTTLVAEWVHNLSEAEAADRIAWLSLDESDNDPACFLAYLTSALRTLEATLGEGTLSALQSPQPPPAEAVLTQLINEITAIPGRIVLVLDDYHLIEDQAIHEALAFLLARLPRQMHLVIATREDPHVPLARLRARGQLTELRAADLRFSRSEAAEFLNQVMGLELPEEDVAALETRTEGWIAGLQLAALALQGTISEQGHQDTHHFVQSFTGSHRFVLDYLIEEVLERQTESVQAFLLQTAILERLNGSLCDSVRSPRVASGGAGAVRPGSGAHGNLDDGQSILEWLEHANLFIVPLDEERRWYRYQNLFADLLRQRLRQAHPEWLPALHQRASEWYEQNGFADEAIEHALRAGDFEQAADLLEELVDTMWQRGEHTRLRRWLAGLPAELISSKPHLGIVQAWDQSTRGEHDAAEQSLGAAEAALEASHGRATEASPPAPAPLPEGERLKVRGRAAAIRAFLASYRGDLPGTIQHAKWALEHLPEEDTSWRCTAAIALGDAYSFSGELAAAHQARLQAVEACKRGGNIRMIACLKLADSHRQQGQLRRTVEICREQWALARKPGLSKTVTAGWLLAIWGETLAEQGDLDRAKRQATKGVKLAERGQDVMVIGWSNLCLARVLYSTGDLAGAGKIIQKLATHAQKHDVPPFVTNPMAAWQARIWLAQGKLEAATQWVVERGLDGGPGATLLREMEYMVLARILMAQGRLAEAARLLQRLIEAAEAGGHTLSLYFAV